MLGGSGYGIGGVHPLANPLAVNPLAMNPLAVNPLAVNPLAMNPLAMNPLAVNPLAMNPLAVNQLAAASAYGMGGGSPLNSMAGAYGMAGFNPYSRKRGMFAEPDQVSKRLCTTNPEYQVAFQTFDTDRSGTIDICELNNALLAVKQSVEGSTMKACQYFTQHFQPNTVLWLAAGFAASGGGVIAFPQFAEMMNYLSSVKEVFAQIDVDRSGDLSVGELSRALNLSGFNVTGFPGGVDQVSMLVAEKIGRAYDADRNGVLSFDEFVQLRLEWDCYLDAWAANVPPGSDAIAPQQLLGVLEAIKKSLEPVGMMAMNPALAGLQGFNAQNFLGGLYYSSMFQVQRPFLLRTAELLIGKFGAGTVMINFEQFCMMMEFIKESKQKFLATDQDRSGKIDLHELAAGLTSGPYGMPMPAQQLMEIGRRYDQDGSGQIEFDEFLQMMTEVGA